MSEKKVILAARPSAGIWYYVYDGSWRLLMWRSNEAPYTGHPEVWEHIIAPTLSKKLNLDGSRAKEIGQLPYCMPRGRVDASEQLDDGTYKWAFYHGNDFPSSFNIESEKRKLVSYFNLTGPLINGKVSFLEVGHEKMMDTEKAKFKEITGVDVPY